MARRPVAEEALLREEAYEDGLARGRREGQELSKKELSATFSQAKVDMMRAAADLATANSKLAYAMSRILSKDGW